MKISNVIITVTCTVLFIAHSCEIEKPEIPVGLTNRIKDIEISIPEVIKIYDGSVEVICHNLILDNIAGITSKGFCWSTSKEPTIEDSKLELKQEMNIGHIEGLSREFIYHIRAFVTNGVDVVYSDVLHFNWFKWQRTFGGELEDRSHSACHTSDSGCVIAGFCSSPLPGHHGGKDFYIIRLNAMGNVIWEKVLGGSGDDEAFVVKPIDEDYIVAGYTFSNDGDVTGRQNTDDNADFWIVRLNEEGNIVWQSCFGGDGNDKAKALEILNNRIIVAGPASSTNYFFDYGKEDFLVVTTDLEGNEKGHYSFGGQEDEGALSLIRTSDNGFIIAGYSQSSDGIVNINYGESDAWIVKVNQSIEMEWELSFGGSLNEWAKSVIEMPDQSYMVALYSISKEVNISETDNDKDAILIKISPSGELEIFKKLGGPGTQEATSVIITHDNNLMIAGRNSEIIQRQEDFWIVKLDMKGRILWGKNFGGESNDDARAIIQTVDNDYIVTGNTSSVGGDVTDARGNYDIWVVRF